MYAVPYAVPHSSKSIQFRELSFKWTISLGPLMFTQVSLLYVHTQKKTFTHKKKNTKITEWSKEVEIIFEKKKRKYTIVCSV